MGWLLAIGLVHAYLIWDGDILVTYALCGMLLLWWVRGWPAGRLAAAAVALLVVGAAFGALSGLAWNSLPEEVRASESEYWTPTREQFDAQLEVLHGSYTEVLATRAPSAFEGQTSDFLAFYLWRGGGMMLLGMALWKWGFLDGRRATRDYAVTAASCLPIGLALNYTGAALASIGYAATLILIVRTGALGRLRHALSSVGQMALTNYLMHSVIGAIVFLGWGSAWPAASTTRGS